LGTVRTTMNETGEIENVMDCYPFGEELTGRSIYYGTQAKYKFTGKERDTETSYDYFGARYYDSQLGRWLQVDPLAEKYPGWSTYNYTLNNPLLFIDPVGTDTLYFNSDGSYTGRYSKGGKNIGHVLDSDGNFSKSFSFLDPSDVSALKSTRDSEGNLLPQDQWQMNGDQLYTTGLNLSVEACSEAIIASGTSGLENRNVNKLAVLLYIYYESKYDPNSQLGRMDFTAYNNLLGKLLPKNQLAVVGNMAYNRFDAGNYYWGAAMAKFGFSAQDAQLAARLYERYLKNREDQFYDQTAIWNGARRITK
jgi:RHS repeat-associated protein